MEYLQQVKFDENGNQLDPPSQIIWDQIKTELSQLKLDREFVNLSSRLISEANKDLNSVKDFYGMDPDQVDEATNRYKSWFEESDLRNPPKALTVHQILQLKRLLFKAIAIHLQLKVAENPNAFTNPSGDESKSLDQALLNLATSSEAVIIEHLFSEQALQNTTIDYDQFKSQSEDPEVLRIQKELEEGIDQYLNDLRESSSDSSSTNESAKE